MINFTTITKMGSGTLRCLEMSSEGRQELLKMSSNKLLVSIINDLLELVLEQERIINESGIEILESGDNIE